MSRSLADGFEFPPHQREAERGQTRHVRQADEHVQVEIQVRGMVIQHHDVEHRLDRPEVREYPEQVLLPVGEKPEQR